MIRARLISKLTALPPLYCLLCLGAGLAAHFGLERPFMLSLPWSFAIAMLIIGVAIINAVWAVLCLRRAKTTVHPWDIPSAMVTGGPFAITRNPMYLSLLLVQLAAVWWTGGLLVFMAPLLFVLGMNAGRIREEERVLGEKFGAEFEAYRQRVRRWI
jgi:protein-S-isoprenylcysteine O-methyltransferase Ste14